MSLLYGELTWPEVRDASKDRVVVIPVGTLEDHGPHLPLSTDVLIVDAVCRKAVEGVPEKAFLFPVQTHGYSPHHMDFPGTITIKGTIFLEYMLDIIRSLAHHGFKKMLLVNGHGSNSAWLENVARLAIVEIPSILCCSLNWWAIPEVAKSVSTMRGSERGGTSHACELETSLMLAIRPDLVKMNRAVKELSHGSGEYFPAWDFFYPSGPARLMKHWSTMTETGVMGDPTVATLEKGEAWLAAAAKGLGGIIEEFGGMDIVGRVDHHQP
jgi:creatinine amidohydrolase